MLNLDYFSKSLKYHKILSENAFNFFEAMHSSSENLLEKTLDRYPWVTAYGKEGYLYWSKSCRQTSSNVRIFVEKGYEEAEKFFLEPNETAAPSPKEKHGEKKPAPAKPSVSRKKSSSSTRRSGRPAKAATTSSQKVQSKPATDVHKSTVTKPTVPATTAKSVPSAAPAAPATPEPKTQKATAVSTDAKPITVKSEPTKTVTSTPDITKEK